MISKRSKLGALIGLSSMLFAQHANGIPIEKAIPKSAIKKSSRNKPTKRRSKVKAARKFNIKNKKK